MLVRSFRGLLLSLRLANRDSEAALLENFALSCVLRGLTAKTILCYGERLANLVRWCITRDRSLTGLTRQDILDYVLSCIDRYSAHTINGQLRVFSVFYKWLVEEQQTGENPMVRVRLLKADVTVEPVVKVVDLSRLVKSWADDYFEGCRNRVMVLLTVDAMLRPGELLRLGIHDVDLEGLVLVVHKSKSRIPRYVPICRSTAKSLHSYLFRWRRDIAGEVLFPDRDGNSLRLSSWYNMLYRKGKRLGLHVHPHALRHTAATAYIERGGPMGILQNILGHSDPRTTMNYVHINGLAAREHHEKYSMVADMSMKG